MQKLNAEFDRSSVYNWITMYEQTYGQANLNVFWLGRNPRKHINSTIKKAPDNRFELCILLWGDSTDHRTKVSW